MLAAFCFFVLLAIGVPYAIQRYYREATTAQVGTLEVVTGTVRLSRLAGSPDVAASDGDHILEGYVIKTDDNSRALITLFEGSTIYVFESSEFSISRLRRSRFHKGRTLITLQEPQGRLRVGVALPVAAEAEFVVQTPHGRISLHDGSYAIEVSQQGSTISVRNGLAEVFGLGAAVAVQRGQRSSMLEGQAPTLPGPAARDLLQNGDFRQGELGWTVKTDVEAGKRDDVFGRSEWASGPEGPYVRFVRLGSKNSHGENGLFQAINRDVSDFVSLKLSIDFRLLHHSLSGGGYLGTEYPVMVHLIYRDAAGTQVSWVKGFYSHNLADYPTTYGEQMPSDLWIPYEKDLLDLNGYPKPFRLLSIDISASGWDYESLVRSVSILAE